MNILTATPPDTTITTENKGETWDNSINQNPEKESSDIEEFYSFYIFANSKSGSAQGNELTRLSLEKIVFTTDIPKKANIEINIFNMRDITSRTNGMLALKREQMKGKSDVRAIAAGGDGTVMWVVQELQNYGVDLEQCAIGVIPLGTGNHLSRILGWGKDKSATIKGMNLERLKGMACSWLNSKIEDYDIWEVSIECEADGGIYEAGKVKAKTNIIIEKDQEEVKLKAFTRKLSNYFSIGFGACTGFDFEKYRTNSRYKNMLMYCFTGIKRTFLGINYINNIIESIEKFSPEEERLECEKLKRDQKFVIYPKLKRTKTEPLPGENKTIIDLHKKLSVLAFLNVPHYATGRYVWDSKKAKHGIIKAHNMKKTDFCQHNTNDDLLEIVGFQTPLAVTFGKADLLWQSKAPLVIKFKKNEDPKKPTKVYFEIDGEYFKAVNPKKAIINRSSSLLKLKVMYNTNIKSK